MKDSQSMLVSRFARLGAVVRLRQIEQEAAAIHKMFPRLTATPNGGAAAAQPAAKTARHAKRQMSPEAREAARERMKAYWAKKRQEAPHAAAEKVEASERATRIAAKRRGRGRGRKVARKRR